MRLQVVASVGAAGYFLLNYENAEGKEHVFSGVCSSPLVSPSTCLLPSPSHLPADSTLPTLGGDGEQIQREYRRRVDFFFGLPPR